MRILMKHADACERSSPFHASAPLTRQPGGECTSPDPANLILSYQEIAVPKL